MKALDWVKQHIQEWPEKCTHITVDKSGEIWINEGSPARSKFNGGEWSGPWFDSVENHSGNIDDPQLIILPEHFKESSMKFTTEHYVDVSGWSEEEIKEAAQVMSEQTGEKIWERPEALCVYTNLGTIYLACILGVGVLVTNIDDLSRGRHSLSQEQAEKIIQQHKYSKITELMVRETDLAKSLANAGDTLQQSLEQQHEANERVEKAQKSYQEALEALRSALVKGDV